MTTPTQPPSNFATKPKSQAFANVKNEQGLREWLCRAYFNPEKHSRELYYNSNVTPENVLEFITHDKLFPQTPLAVANIWGIIPTLRSELNSFFNKECADEAKEDARKKAEIEALRVQSERDRLSETNTGDSSEEEDSDEEFTTRDSFFGR